MSATLRPAARAARHTRRWRAALVVAAKEILDSLRDRRTLITMLMAAALSGPLLLLMVSTVLAREEARANVQRLPAIGLAHAPSLADHLARQGLQVEPPPADWNQALADGRLDQAVLVVAPDFEQRLAQGLPAPLKLWSASGDAGSDRAATGPWRQALAAFEQEQLTQRLVQRGVPPGALPVLEIDAFDLTPPRRRDASLLRMLPIFVLMSVLYGAMHIAIDITAGERERGSLEPLLMTPAPLGALVVGKWLAVAALAMLGVALTCLGFLPGRWLLRSEVMAAAFHFGWREALAFMALLGPFAALMAAVLMDIAVRSRSVREAQATASIVVMAVAMAPLLLSMQAGTRPAWTLALPVVGQITLMQRVIAGEPIGLATFALPCAVALALSALALVDLRRRLSRAVQA